MPRIENIAWIEFTNVDCVCPICGVIEKRKIEKDFIESKKIWRKAGYPVVICKDCKTNMEKKE
jgi:hypothetical protein